MTHYLNPRFGAILLFASVLLSGCATTPYGTDMSLNPKEIEMSDQVQMDKLSYLGRFLLTEEDRGRLSQRIVTADYSKFSDPAPMSVGAGMATAQAVNGSMTSQQGMQTAATVGVALRTISLFLPDGSMDTSSGLFLPEKWNGRSLETKEDALVAAWEYVDQRVTVAAESLGRTATCKFRCEDPDFRAYLLTLADETPSAGKFGFNPKYVVMEFAMNKDGLQPYVADKLEVWALGFTPKWFAGDGRMAVPGFREVLLDKQANPMYRKDGNYLTSYGNLIRVPLGRELLRRFYDDGVGYGFYITNTARNFLTYRGETYSFGFPSYRKYIQHKTDELWASKK